MFTLLYYVDYNSRENEKELSQDGKIIVETKGAYKTHRRNLPNSPAFNKCLATFFDNQLLSLKEAAARLLTSAL